MDTAPRFSRLAIIADDLTGAADSGAPFARLGFSTVVVVDAATSGTLPDAAVLVLNTDSRDRGQAEAARLVAATTQLVRSFGARVVYKKIDSLFRGNVGAEIAAAMEATGASECLLAPAFPEQGRTTESGRCVVHGSPLGNGTIEELLDATAPGAFDVTFTDAEAVKSLGSDGGPKTRALRRLLIADASEQRHLVGLAATVLGSRKRGTPLLLAGSGGFAAAIAEVMARSPGKPGAAARETPPSGTASAGRPIPIQGSLVAGRGVLVVSGSRSSEAARQLERLRAATGAPVVTPLEPPEEARGRVRNALAAGRLAVVATDPGPTVAGASSRVAAIAAKILASGARPRIVFVGGETAMATLRLIDARQITLLGEIEPGVAFGRVSESRFGPLDIVTKAGAFGDPETLVRVEERLSLA